MMGSKTHLSKLIGYVEPIESLLTEPLKKRRVEQTTTPMIDLSKTVEPGLEETTTPTYEEPANQGYIC